MEKGGSCIDIPVVVSAQDECYEKIRCESDHCYDQHRERNDRRRMEKAHDGLAEYFDRDGQERGPVHEGGQDFHATESVAVLAARRARGKPHGPIAQSQRENIEEDMRRVGKQGEAAGENTADNFGNESKRCDEDRKDELVAFDSSSGKSAPWTCACSIFSFL
jgi:hypothetical protein